MSISYSNIIGFGTGKVTLPSVETWGTNMNILRDPPKGIFTRKIDKVGQTSEITQMIGDSGNRACEAILVYPRGVNPMVAVSYDNYGNNGGQKSGSLAMAGLNVQGGSGKQSYLPYRIADRGAFRPPIKDQRDLLPLSRLPRIATSSFSQPGFADFSKRAMCPSESGEEFRAIRNNDTMLRACVRPTATYKLETPMIENYEIKRVIKNPVKVEGLSGIQPTAKFNGEMGTPTKINQNPIHAEARTNKNGQKQNGAVNMNTDKYIQETYIKDVNSNPGRKVTFLANMIDTSKYIQDNHTSDVSTNLSQNIQVTPIDELFGDYSKDHTKQTTNISHTAGLSGYEKHDYFHDEFQYQKSLPNIQGQTNIGYNIHKPQDGQISERTYQTNHPTTSVTTNTYSSQYQPTDFQSSRVYNLKPTINPGGYNPNFSMPSSTREDRVPDGDIYKSQMRQDVYRMQQDRNTYLAQSIVDTL